MREEILGTASEALRVSDNWTYHQRFGLNNYFILEVWLPSICQQADSFYAATLGGSPFIRVHEEQYIEVSALVMTDHV
jgi:hypothetical protein